MALNTNGQIVHCHPNLEESGSFALEEPDIALKANPVIYKKIQRLMLTVTQTSFYRLMKFRMRKRILKNQKVSLRM